MDGLEREKALTMDAMGELVFLTRKGKEDKETTSRKVLNYVTYDSTKSSRNPYSVKSGTESVVTQILTVVCGRPDLPSIQ